MNILAVLATRRERPKKNVQNGEKSKPVAGGTGRDETKMRMGMEDGECVMTRPDGGRAGCGYTLSEIACVEKWLSPAPSVVLT